MKTLSVSLIFILFVSCAQNSNEQFNPAQISVEVRQMMDAYHADVKKDGFTAEFKYLDNSEDFFWVPPGYQSALSYDSVRTILEANAKAFRSTVFTWDTLRIVPLSNALATYTGITKGTLIDTAGQTTQVSIIESGTVIKRKDGWKLLCGQSAAL